MLGCFHRAAAALLGLLALAACQPALKSELPVGAAAYESIRATTSPAPPSGPYLLRPGDTVSVNVYQEEELSQEEVPIDQAGMLSLPLIGAIPAAGRSTAEVSADVERAYGVRFLRDPQVTVMLHESRPQTVSIEGQVTKPGIYPVEPGYGLLSAMALGGSPTENAKLNEVLVFRNVNGERLGGRFDLTAIRAGRAADPQILPGDVIVVGFSSLRGIYRDILQASPLLGVFGRY